MDVDDAQHEQTADEASGRSVGDALWAEALDAFSGGAEALDTY